MAVGKRDRRVAEAVDAAEELTGLQFAVYLGAAPGDTKELAERLFVAAELKGQQPAVLVAVSTAEHRVEILTAEWAQTRVPDAACDATIEMMRPALKSSKYDEALVLGVRHLAEVAGPGVSAAGDVELPDFFDER